MLSTWPPFYGPRELPDAVSSPHGCRPGVRLRPTGHSAVSRLTVRPVFIGELPTMSPSLPTNGVVSLCLSIRVDGELHSSPQAQYNSCPRTASPPFPAVWWKSSMASYRVSPLIAAMPCRNEEDIKGDKCFCNPSTRNKSHLLIYPV